MIKYVIFDVFETLVTLNNNPYPYFGQEIAKDMGVPWEQFSVTWRKTDKDRTLGKITFEETIKNIMLDFACFSDEKYSIILNKRYEHREYSFKKVRKDIVTMLSELKKEDCKIGILSNCFSEEQECIRKSELLNYLDTAVLSCEVGMAKPSVSIFELCMKNLWQSEKPLEPSQFLYVGDGGSEELETASKLGMITYQATWYLKDDVNRLACRKPEFKAFDEPLKVVDLVKRSRVRRL